MNTKMPRPLATGHRHERGFFLMTDLIVGMAILTLAIIPLAFSFARDQRLLRAEYYRAAAVEIVDGEMEVLAAGAWRDFPEGQQVYTVHAATAAHLPPGRFEFTRAGNHLRLEWKSDKRVGVGEVVREVTVK
jgi:hypothetical protein